MQRRLFLSALGLGAATAGCAVADGFAKPPEGTRHTSGNLDRWRHALAGSRLYAMIRLREYAASGRFPRNHRALGHIPVFVDEHGTHCAVGYLMLRSGHGHTAKQVAATNNNVYVEKIDRGPALDWILFSGLTQAECADIQPSYKHDNHRPDPVGPTETQRLQQHFAEMGQRLLDDTDTSLDAAVARLEPLIRSGASIDRVVR